jgi:hypothetical protein
MRLVAGMVLVLCVLEAAALGGFAARFPAPPRIDRGASAQTVADRVAEIEAHYLPSLPPLTETLASRPDYFYEGYRQELLHPTEHQQQTWSLEERIDRYNENLSAYEDDYVPCAWMLMGILGVASLVLAWITIRGPSYLTIGWLLAGGLFVMPPATEAIIGRDHNLDLVPLILPQLLAAALMLVVRVREHREHHRRAERSGARKGTRAVLAGIAMILVGGVCVAWGVEENVRFLITVGAALLANALVAFGVVGIRLIARRITRR